MDFSQEHIKRIEMLARLKLSDEQRAMYQSQLSQITDYIDRLNELDTEGVEIKHPHHLSPRPDEVIEQETSREELLGCSPQEVVGNQISIPNIMK